jgi:DNA-directed RNA polymerase sigma subunit (sigma70/sigma32)
MDYLGCMQECRQSKQPCNRENCRHWIDYSEDLNCSVIAAEDHGPMTLDEISKRLDMTLVRVKQIQDEALIKMKKRMLPVLHE